MPNDHPLRWLGEHWRAFWFTPSRPTNLGIWRLIFYTAVLFFHSGQDYSAWADVSDLFWRPIRLFGVIPPFVLPADTLRMLTAFWTIALTLSCIGLFTRVSTVASFVIGAYLIGLPNNFGRVHHNAALTIFMLAILACSRCGDAWSVDRLIALVRRPTAKNVLRPPYSAEYTWPLRLSCVLMTLAFFGAGTMKLRQSGLAWITSDNMANKLARGRYSHQQWLIYLAHRRWASSLIAGLTVVLETSAPLALFSRLIRTTVLPSLFLMQIGIWLVMGILFRDWFVLYLLWVPWDRLGDWLVKRSQDRHVYAVLYDGSCGLCRRTIGVLHALDPLRRIELYDVHANWRQASLRYPSLSQQICLEEMHVVAPTGKIVTGFDGYRALAWVIPVAWPALPVLYVPGVRAVGRRVYSAIALRRSCAIGRTDGLLRGHAGASSAASQSSGAGHAPDQRITARR